MSTFCPNCGKRMDSSWKTCPYCAREKQAGKGKVLDSQPQKPEDSMTDHKERQPTRVGRDAPPAGGRKTEFYPVDAEPRQDARRAPDNRRIVGVLVSYTWEPVGQLFEVREGRTHIGAGDIKGESRQVDVCCPRDPMLSSDHAMILVQRGQFYIQDLSSVNGTMLDGRPLRPESSEPLPSPAEIKAGDTTFTFVKFDVSPSTSVPETREEPREGSRRPTTLR
jgi:hypothetical protein